MHIARQTTQELIVVASTRWVSAICAAAALFTLYFVITRHEPKGLFLAAFFLLFALIMDLRKTFTFDAGQRIVRWNGRKVFKAESGEIPFDDITEIGTEASAGERGVPIYRLTIITREPQSPWLTPTAGTKTVTPFCAGRSSTSSSPAQRYSPPSLEGHRLTGNNQCWRTAR